MQSDVHLDNTYHERLCQLGFFTESLNEFRLNNENPYDSPLIQILQCCQEFGVLDIIKKMASETCGMISKTMSKKLVRDTALGVQINQ